MFYDGHLYELYFIKLDRIH